MISFLLYHINNFLSRALCNIKQALSNTIEYTVGFVEKSQSALILAVLLCEVDIMLFLIKIALQNLLFFGLHFDGKNLFPKALTPKEEEECIKKIAEGSEQARNELIIHNLRLVAHIVKKNYPEAKDQDDLVSIGTIGLIRAAETFDYQKGNHFSTYASKCIDNAITHFRKRLFSCKKNSRK